MKYQIEKEQIMIIDKLELHFDDYGNEAAICISAHFMNKIYRHCVLIDRDRNAMSAFKGLFELCHWLLEKEKEHEISNRD